MNDDCSDDAWKEPLLKAVRNVVAIHFCHTRCFDGAEARRSQATGFVVDSKGGADRCPKTYHDEPPHPRPWTFLGLLRISNREKVDCYPVYVDPVHDFGLLRYNPKASEYIQADGLNLTPQNAKVGLEIRVVGNDAGERLSILQGVISLIDRNAPEYGEGYNDFNINYYQASASASGGSSGSPVICKDGTAVALQAGGRCDGASTEYFLPLDRPLRALKCIQQEKPVTRGDIQVQFLLKPFDECRHLGLTPEWEAAIRQESPDNANLLVAETILPDGPSHHKIETGDVLLQVSGKILTQFLDLEDILDSNVGEPIQLHLRRGDEDINVEIEVGNLHKITPDRFVSVAGGCFHNMSYQQARFHGVGVTGVRLCKPTGSFRLGNNENGCIIQSVAGKKVPDLDSFIDVMRGIPDQERITVSYKYFSDLNSLKTAVIRVDRHWDPKMTVSVRNDSTGQWDLTDLGGPFPPKPLVRRSASFVELNIPNPSIAALVRSFVHVRCTMPFNVDGFPPGHKEGMGLVVNAERGYVFISRAIVPHELCDITITIAETFTVDGRVVLLHPLKNLAIVKYDPSLVDAPVTSVRFSSEPLLQDSKTYFFGHDGKNEVLRGPTTVINRTAVTIPANSAAPRYRAINVDAIVIDGELGNICNSGVLVAEDGTVQALWLLYLCDNDDEVYHLGLDAHTLLPVISAIQSGETPKIRLLSVELSWLQLSDAEVMGVSDKWVKEITRAKQSHRRVFMVSKCPCGHGGSTTSLLEGDIILTLNGKICTTIADFDILYTHDYLQAVIVRANQEIHLKLPTSPADNIETNHLVLFCGAVLHAPNQAVRQQGIKLPGEIYVSACYPGSPAEFHSLSPTTFITQVNNELISDLRSFITAVRKIPDNTYFRLETVTLGLVPRVICLRKNELAFPMMEWFKDESARRGWRCKSVTTSK